MRHPSMTSYRLGASITTLLVTLLFNTAAHANVKPAPYFQDHAVLQAGKAMPVWGTADAGEKVTVSFAGQTASTTADTDGKWRVNLKPLKVNADASTLTITGNNTVAITDVLVGEVWLCAGQSNMEFRVDQANNSEAEIANGNHPLIRQLIVNKNRSNTPLTTASAAWSVSSPSTVGKFTAVGYFFAREVQAKLGLPIGIINSTWGGTDIEAWLTQDSVAADDMTMVNGGWQKRLDAFPANKIKYDAQVAEEETKFNEAKARGEVYKKRYINPIANPDGSPHFNKPFNLYNAMVYPIVPIPLAGILWYQAENNWDRATQYRAMFPMLIKGWRTAFDQPDLPFYWVQLPNYSSDWAKLREAQSSALSLPNTAQAITIDVGEVNDIHPKNKQDVGHRLALIALKNHYGKDVIASGPTVAKISFSKDTATVKFADLAGGLKAKGDVLNSFEIAGEDKVFKPADATISGDTVTVKSAEVSAPVAVRYLWRNPLNASLYNKADLPAAPFRSDIW
jgi:sialate O-acetylesterase